MKHWIRGILDVKANELKKGTVIGVESQHVLITQVTVQTAASRSGNTLYKARGRDIASRQKFERSYKGDDWIDTVEFERRPVQLLFRDGTDCTFMDTGSYEQFVISSAELGDESPYITDGLEGFYALLVDERLVAVELPPAVTLQIVECAPAIKGASAAARTKPATLDTGLVVQVPEYLERGDSIRVNTESGAYMSRA